MTAASESVLDAVLQLDAEERCQLPGMLWKSVSAPPCSLDEATLERTLDERDADLEHDPSLEVTHGGFLAHFASRRKT